MPKKHTAVCAGYQTENTTNSPPRNHAHERVTQLSYHIKNSKRYKQNASPIPSSLPGNIGSFRGSRPLREAQPTEITSSRDREEGADAARKKRLQKTRTRGTLSGIEHHASIFENVLAKR
jgi:hypothetical protein